MSNDAPTTLASLEAKYMGKKNYRLRLANKLKQQLTDH